MPTTWTGIRLIYHSTRATRSWDRARSSLPRRCTSTALTSEKRPIRLSSAWSPERYGREREDSILGVFVFADSHIVRRAPLGAVPHQGRVVHQGRCHGQGQGDTGRVCPRREEIQGVYPVGAVGRPEGR